MFPPRFRNSKVRVRRFKSSQKRNIDRRPHPRIFSVTWLAGDVKEPTHLPETVAPGVVFDLTLSDGLVLHIGINSLHRSRIVKEKLLRLCMTN